MDRGKARARVKGRGIKSEEVDKEPDKKERREN
jgi:hypothetical protein